MSQLRRLRRAQEPRSEVLYRKAIEIAEKASKVMKGFSDEIARELGVESGSVNLVRDALKARLREHRELEDFKNAVAAEIGFEIAPDTQNLFLALKERLKEKT